ncbi:uncharacterized protein [Amphiura filiformis]|uniref:uncharacterized protein n=1 Tax=Amphiura filiformis TaxID=82378 RepID=UPI003B22661B
MFLIIWRLPDCTSHYSSAISHPTDPSRCYYVTQSNARTYAATVTLCTNYGWTPVNIEDEEENEIIYQAMNSNAAGYWLAQNDKVEENVWTYHDQSNCNGVFLNFDQANREPDGGTSKNCLVMSSTNGGRWKDESCSDDSFYAMCKLKQQPLNTPAPEANMPTTTTRPTTTLPTTNPPTTTTLPTTNQHTTTLPTTNPPTTTMLTTILPAIQTTTKDFILDQHDVAVQSSTPRLSTIQVKTKLRCAMTCTRIVECASFTFKSTAQLCELYGTVIDQIQLSVQSGSNYFIRN